MKKICPVCNSEFNAHHGNTKFCSSCKKIIKRESLKIRSKRFRDKCFENLYTTEQISKFKELAERQQILDDFNREGKCYICPRTGIMIPHHIRYNPLETILLCTRCHSTLHHRFLNHKKCRPR